MPSFSGLSHLREVKLSLTQLTGTLVAGDFVDLGQLEILDIFSVGVSGVIPPTIHLLTSLKMLGLRGTLLTGMTP
jgi:hypothetical protein